jgi:hypothetical protein
MAVLSVVSFYSEDKSQGILFSSKTKGKEALPYASCDKIAIKMVPFYLFFVHVIVD